MSWVDDREIEIVTVKGQNIATYNIQIFAPDLEIGPDEEFPADVPRLSEDDKRVLADLPAVLETAEEAIESFLPDGYSVRIREWNK